MTFKIIYDIIYIEIKKGVAPMEWKSLREQFNEKFPDYSVDVCPPCISLSREMEYIYRAYAVALGKSTAPNVKIDHENKRIIFNR